MRIIRRSLGFALIAGAILHFAGTAPPASAAMVPQAEVEPNNTSAQANAVDLRAKYAAVTGELRPGGDIDFFSFTAPAGSRIWAETDTGGTQNAGATSRDTVIDLLAADGTTVIENDDDDGTGNGGDGTVETGLASLIAGRTLTASGTYFVRVRAFNATAIISPYRLSLILSDSTTPTSAEAEANNDAAGANTLLTGAGTPAIRTGAINAAGDQDWYSVVATAGQVLAFMADDDPERDGTGTDLVLELRDPSAVLLLAVDSSITGSIANPSAEGARYAITTSGTYYIKVRHFSATGTGTYHLMAALESLPLAPAGPGTITLTADVAPKPLVPSGQPLTWTFVVTNTGSDPAPGVTFSATLPAGLKIVQTATAPAMAQACTLTSTGQRIGCALGALGGGQSVTITISATMQSVALGTNLCATGQVNAGAAGATVSRQAQSCTRVSAPTGR